MIRKYNYTGRIKISRDRIQVSQRGDGTRRFFTVSLNLSELNLPPKARIYIEPYFKSSFMRFNFGTVDRFEEPQHTYLSEIPITDRVLYRVKIVDESESKGLILAYGDEILADSGDGLGAKSSLLPVDFNDLGSQIWCLEFREEGPVLAANCEGNIPKIRELVKSPVFVALVYPEIVRQVASKIFSDHESFMQDPESWPSRWIRFFRESLAVPVPYEPLEDENDRREMISVAVNNFSKRCDAIQSIDQFINTEQ